MNTNQEIKNKIKRFENDLLELTYFLDDCDDSDFIKKINNAIKEGKQQILELKKTLKN